MIGTAPGAGRRAGGPAGPGTPPVDETPKER